MSNAPNRWLLKRTLSSTTKTTDYRVPFTQETGVTPRGHANSFQNAAQPREFAKTSLAIANTQPRTERVLDLSQNEMQSRELARPRVAACKSVTTREQYWGPLTVWASLW